jgi:hypothetical protein
MRILARAGGVGLLVGVLAGCTLDGSADEHEVRMSYGLMSRDLDDVPLCRSIEREIEGLHAAVFRLATSETFFAASAGGVVVCVDEAPVIVRAGLIPITSGDEPACRFCDGTPLPAEHILEVARKYYDQPLGY